MRKAEAVPARDKDQGRRFELRGGDPALDFVNTVAWRLTDHPVDYLESWGDVLAWGRQAGLLATDGPEAHGATEQPTSTAMQETLARARELRETIHRVVTATMAGGAPDGDDLSELNGAISEAFSRRRLAHGGGNRYEWGWDAGSDSERVLWEVTQSAAALLASSALDMVKTCADPGCGWLFVDASRNHSRRWCDSRDCGNRERVRRHVARRRTARAAS